MMRCRKDKPWFFFMPFDFEKTAIEGLVLVKPRIFVDERGFFLETYKDSEFQEHVPYTFVQTNMSQSRQGVIRALHYQRAPYAQGKLVQVLAGSIWDVAVDMRRGSPTFLQWYGVVLDDVERQLFFIPPGFAHGFVVTSGQALIQYSCTHEYVPTAEGGIRWDDPQLAIPWGVDEPIVAERDQALPMIEALGDGDFY